MTENLMTKLNVEDTALLVKLSQVREDDNPGETITYFINKLYADLVWLKCLSYKRFITTTEQLKTIANYNNLSEAEQLRNILYEACDFEGVSLL